MGSALLDAASRVHVERLRHLPDAAREFAVDGTVARRYGLHNAILDELIDAGLPHRVRPRGPLFDEADLKFLGLRLGTAKDYVRIFRTYADSVRWTENQEAVRVTVTVRWRWDMMPKEPVSFCGGDVAESGMVTSPSGVRTFSLLLSTKRRPLPKDVVVALEPMRSFEHYLLSDAARGDETLAHKTGLVDCTTGAAIVTGILLRSGFQARTRSGLWLASPLSAVHTWAEVLVNDEWLPVDPVFGAFVARFGTRSETEASTHIAASPIVALGLPPGGALFAGCNLMAASYMTRPDVPPDCFVPEQA